MRLKRNYNNHTYVGKAAEASKEFISNGQVGRLHEGHHALMYKLYKRYLDIDDTFKSIADTAPNARVDTEVMKKGKRDFSVYSEVTNDDAHFIENYAEEIKKRFEKYLKGEKGVTVPDYRLARKAYEELCGEGGHLDESIDKCFEFDESALSAINRSGLEGQIYDHTRDITNVARALDGFRVYTPDVEKTSLSLLALNNAKVVTAFNSLNPNKNNAEVVQLANLLNVNCSLNTVVDAATVSTATELALLNCKTAQDRAAVMQCSAMIAPAEAIITIGSILETLAAIIAETNPVGIAITLILILVGVIIYEVAESQPAEKKEDTSNKEKAGEAEEKSGAQSQNANPSPPDDDDDEKSNNNSEQGGNYDDQERLDNANDVANQIKENGGKAPNGYKGGRTYNNVPKNPTDQKLPEGTNYREYDVNPRKPGVNRGAERIVIGEDGSVWYTNDHYHSFFRIQ